jgi:hypothetical protein
VPGRAPRSPLRSGRRLIPPCPARGQHYPAACPLP